MKKTAEPNKTDSSPILLPKNRTNRKVDPMVMLNSRINTKIGKPSFQGAVDDDKALMDEFAGFGGQLEESSVIYDKNSHKLSISLCLYKSLRVVAEIYELNGHLLARFFDRNLEKGRLVIDQFVNSFTSGILVVLLNSSEGRKYFKIVID
jgi:hypothetical protein